MNAAIDRTIAVPNFRLGRRHRAIESRTVAGGKGVNVARALKLLGRPVISTGLAGGATGTRVVDRLSEESILNAFTRIGGESRTNLAVIDPTSGEQTELNERGPQVTEDELKLFIDQLLYLAQGARLCVLAGSIPPGLSSGVYARLIAELKSLGVLTILDCDAEPMRAALRAEPDIVAPNIAEAEEAVGHEFVDEESLGLGLSGLIEMGAGEAIVTRSTGCTAIVRESGATRRYEVETEPLEPVSTVGSGDCFLAGYVAARYEGASAGECLAFGVACGAESTQHFGAGTLDAAACERLLARVEVRDLDVSAGVR